MNWEAFKQTKFAIKCTSDKNLFFSECAKHGIYNFMSERAMRRDLFICRLCYADRFSKGRYELMSIDEWQTRENRLFGRNRIEVINYDTNDR